MVTQEQVEVAYSSLLLAMKNHGVAAQEYTNHKRDLDLRFSLSLAKGEVAGRNEETRKAEFALINLEDMQKLEALRRLETDTHVLLDMAKVEVERVHLLVNLMRLNLNE